MKTAPVSKALEDREIKRAVKPPGPPDLSGEAYAVLDALSGKCLGLSGLTEETGFADPVLKSVLLELVFAGAVQEISPGLYVRVLP